MPPSLSHCKDGCLFNGEGGRSRSELENRSWCWRENRHVNPFEFLIAANSPGRFSVCLARLASSFLWDYAGDDLLGLADMTLKLEPDWYSVSFSWYNHPVTGFSHNVGPMLNHVFLITREVQQFQISVPVSVSVQLWTKPSPSLPTYQYRSFSLSGIGICPQIKYWLGSI